jgi:predicted DCC family thiol-disulfide oxidoreductase YuxK
VDRIYFDGGCALCRGWVRRVLAADREGTRFRFAPLGGETFAARIPPGRRAETVGSLVVETPEGDLLLRSDAVIRILRGLGRRRTAACLAAIPRPLRDLGYRVLARLRRVGCPGSGGACPTGEPGAETRFEP